jgi:hypothetical protein
MFWFTVGMFFGIMLGLAFLNKAMAAEWCVEWDRTPAMERETYIMGMDNKVLHKVRVHENLETTEVGILAVCLVETRQSYIADISEACKDTTRSVTEDIDALGKATATRVIGCMERVRAAGRLDK